MQDEILTRLAKVADLKVISRTSTQHFKSSPDNLPQIARQLGVAHILEGSVQKANDQVRVNVQLINAATDAHLWAETFDRKLTDIFAVESEIAKTIAETLQAKLTGSEKTCDRRKRRRRIRKLTSFISKADSFGTSGPAVDLRKSIEYFKQAIDEGSQLRAGLCCFSRFIWPAPFLRRSFPSRISGAGKSCGEESAGTGRFVS